MRCSFAVLVTVACGFNPSGSSGSAGLGAADDTTGSTTADATSGSEVGTSGSVASDTGSEAEVSGPVPPSGWMWRRELTIEVGPLELLDPLHDVPVLVVLDPARIDYAKTQPAGQDLRFNAVDGTPLPHEIELWVPGERSFVWVLVPSIDPVAGAVLHMEYGNADAEDEQDPLRVWSNGFVAVWHLAEGCAGGSVRDSTGNDLHASCIELDDGSVFGAIGRGLELATPTQQLRVPHDAMLSFDSGVTVEAFVALDEKTIAMQEDRFAVRKYQSYSLAATHQGTGQNHGPRFSVQVEERAEPVAIGMLAPSWHALAGTADEGGRVRLFVDAVQVGGVVWPEGGQLTPSTEVLVLGDNLGGRLDEVRISAVARDRDWLVLQEASMRDRLLSFGDEAPL